MTDPKQPPPTKILQARYSSGQAFLDDLNPEEGQAGAIYYETKIPLNVDEPLPVYVK